jgi:NADH-quinone oxidoreductase E subunit
MTTTAMETDNWKSVEAASEATLTPEIVAFIRECHDRKHPESQLISVLHKVQGHFGFIGPEQLEAVAQLLRVPSAKVAGVATFYHFFRLKPRGKYIINVCMGTACYVKGSDQIAQRLKDELGIDFGETTKDGIFTLEATRCLGTCGLAPVLMVGDTIHGRLTPDQIPAIVKDYIEKAKR